jgi:hypothetical protein
MSTLSILKQEGSARPGTPAASKALVIGPASGGVKETKVYTFTNPKDVEAEIGFGPATLAAQLVMSRAPSGFGSVDVVVSSGSVAPTITTVATASPAITVSAMTAAGAFERYNVKVQITKEGTVGQSRFRYSLDGGATYSGELKTDATYVFPNTNLSASFTAGTHLAGNEANFKTTAPMLNAADLNACFEVLETQTDAPTLILVAADSSDPEECEPLFSALDTKLGELNSKYKYTQAVLPVGGESKLQDGSAGSDTTADVLAETAGMATSVGNFIQVVAERCNTVHPLARAGYARPRLPFAYAVAAEQHAVGRDISKLLSDPMNYCSNPSYDDFQNGTVYLPEAVSAPRTWVGEPGVFVNQSLLKSAPLSTYDLWPKGRVTNRAAAVLKSALRPFINQRVRVLTDGTGRIDPRDKAAIEGTVNAALRDALLNVQNGQGFLGHVSGLLFTVNGENNLLSTGLLQSTCQIVPLGYIRDIEAIITLENELPVVPVG